MGLHSTNRDCGIANDAAFIGEAHIRCYALQKKTCEIVLKTLFEEKDATNVQNNMQEVEIRPNLWLQEAGQRSIRKPHALYVMKEQERKDFHQHNSRVEDSYRLCGRIKKESMQMGDCEA